MYLLKCLYRLSLPGMLIVCLSLTGCFRSVVRDDFPDVPPIPVLNSVIIEGENLEAHLSWLGKVNAAGIDVIDDASVRLFVDDVYDETMQYTGDGIYESTLTAEIGKTYRYEVLVPELENTVIAESRVPLSSDITGIRHIDHAGIDNEGIGYPAVKITFTNDVSQVRYYEVIIKLNWHEDEWRSAGLEKIVDPVIIAEGLPIAVFSNRTMHGDTYELTLNYWVGTGMNGRMDLFPLIVELRSVSEDYYTYVRQLYLYDEGRYDIDIEQGSGAFQLHTNVRNGYGIVAGYSAVQSDIIYPEGIQ